MVSTLSIKLPTKYIPKTHEIGTIQQNVNQSQKLTNSTWQHALSKYTCDDSGGRAETYLRPKSSRKLPIITHRKGPSFSIYSKRENTKV